MGMTNRITFVTLLPVVFVPMLDVPWGVNRCMGLRFIATVELIAGKTNSGLRIFGKVVRPPGLKAPTGPLLPDSILGMYESFQIL